MDIPNNNKPYLNIEMTNTLTLVGESDDINPLPAETRG
jgi:hypothetical protein